MPETSGILLANLKVSAVSLPLPTLPHVDVPSWTSSPEPPWGNRTAGPQPGLLLQTCCGPCVRAGPSHVPLLPSACLWKRKKERGRGENGCQYTIVCIEGKEITRPGLGNTQPWYQHPCPRPLGATLFTCFSEGLLWLAAWRADGTAWQATCPCCEASGQPSGSVPRDQGAGMRGPQAEDC